jgi:hypothetical protein
MKRMMLVGCGLVLLAVAANATTREPVEYKTFRLSTREVMIACKEDASPKVDVRGEFVFVSCPKP